MLSGRQGGFGASPNRSFAKGRLIVAAVIIIFSLFSYMGSKEYNPVTGENQYIGLTPKQEIALGLQAAPEMIQQYGGLYPDEKVQLYLDNLGFDIVRRSKASETGWQFEFHLLNDNQTINAFALPGGQVFITTALYNKLTTEGQLAGILGHEIGHVVARHSAQRVAKSNLTQGILNAVLVASSDPSQQSGQVAAMLAQLVNMKYGREDELESDRIGVLFMSQAGYDPSGMVGVMEILDKASSGNRPPEFYSTHPNPDNRISEIKKAIQELFPEGVPAGYKE